MEEKFNMCRTVVVGRVDVRVTVSNSLWCQHTSRRLLICLIALRINILYYTYAGILYVTGTTAVSYSIYLIYLYFSTSSATVLMLTQTPSADEFASRAGDRRVGGERQHISIRTARSPAGMIE